MQPNSNGLAVSGHYTDSVVQQLPMFGGVAPASDIVMFIAGVADDIPIWGTNVRSRDRLLREFYKAESMLSGTVYGTAARYASFKYVLSGPERQVNIMQRILHNSEHGSGWQKLMIKAVKDELCLAARSKVALGGDRLGKYKNIRDIVKDKDTGPVLSVDEYGHVVEKNINEWHVSPLGTRRWWHIVPKHAKYGGLYLTEDHPMLTDRGWLRANDISVGMKIATEDVAPSRQQAETLVGTLLGDASLGFVTQRAILRFTHSTKQKDWLDYKLSLFKGFQWTGYATDIRIRGDKESSQVSVNSRATLGLNDWYERWYPNGSKHICREDIETYFGPRMLAAWYCDDGSLHRNSPNNRGHVSLYSDGFDLDDNEWLANLLTQHGFAAHVVTITMKDHELGGRTIVGREYSHIRLETDAAWEFLNYIAPYIPECMRYKLPPRLDRYFVGRIGANSKYKTLQVPDYEPSTAEIEPAVVVYDEIVECKPKSAMAGYTEAKTTFHIGVEGTHTFVAAGMVSHNTQDNAGFIEAIRTEDSYKAPVIQLNHLDSSRCQRTGNWETPVVYTDLQGGQHKLKWYQVYDLAEYPDPDERFRGYQQCAVSRLLSGAQKMRDISLYEREKFSGRNPTEINLVTGIGQERIEAILKLDRNRADNAGQQRYMVPSIIAGLDPTARVALETIKLRGSPDGWDKAEDFKEYIVLLALAFGLDPQDIAPLSAGNLGSAQQSQVLAQKGRGKGPALFMSTIEHMMNFHGIMPSSVTFHYQEQDDAENEAKTNLWWRRVQGYKILATPTKTGNQAPGTPGSATAERGGPVDGEPILPIKIIRQIMRDNGDLPQEYLDALGEDDLTPTTDLTSDDKPTKGS